MPIISTKKGAKVGLIYGGESNNKIIRINDKHNDDESDDESSNEDLMFLINHMLEYEKDRKRVVKQCDSDILRECLLSDKEPRDVRLKRIYKECKTILNNRKGKEYFITSGNVQPLPITTQGQVDVGFICGPSGSGKSTYVAKWVIEYISMNPNNEVYLFSRKSSDDTLDLIPNLVRILLDESYEDDEEDPLDKYEDSCIIFDDIDTLKDNTLREKIRKLRDDLLETGRCKNITVLSTSHLITNWKVTRANLNEASFITLFPNQGGSQQIKMFLKNYQGLNKEQIDRIVKLPSRWVTIYRRAPQYIIYECGIYLLD